VARRKSTHKYGQLTPRARWPKLVRGTGVDRSVTLTVATRPEGLHLLQAGRHAHRSNRRPSLVLPTGRQHRNWLQLLDLPLHLLRLAPEQHPPQLAMSSFNCSISASREDNCSRSKRICSCSERISVLSAAESSVSRSGKAARHVIVSPVCQKLFHPQEKCARKIEKQQRKLRNRKTAVAHTAICGA